MGGGGAFHFSHKKGRVGKLREVVLKRGVSFYCVLYVCVVLFIPFLLVFFVSWKEVSFSKSIQQICDFYK